MSHLQARTIFVCNVTVLVLGSQNEHSDIANKYSLHVNVWDPRTSTVTLQTDIVLT